MHSSHGPVPPLDGLRVVEYATYVAGPSGGMALAQLGADVIRVDPIGGATDFRRWPMTSDETASLYWLSLNRGKRSVAIDTRSPAGRELLRELACAPGEDAGIFVTNAVGQSWLDPERFRERRADLIYVEIKGHPDGRPAVDYTVNCAVGLPDLTGPADAARPVNHVLPAWDLLTGLHAALGVLAGDRIRRRTGEGHHVSIALSDVAVAGVANLGLLADASVNKSRRVRDGNYLYGSFGCDFVTRDGRRVMVVALTERQWENLITLTGVAEVFESIEKLLGVDLSDEGDRYTLRDTISSLLAPWFEARDSVEVAIALDASRVLWGPYQTIDELVRDPASLLHRTDVVETIDQPGVGSLPTTASPLRFDGTPPLGARPGPQLGQHTEEVLADVLHLSTAEIGRLVADGVVATGRTA